MLEGTVKVVNRLGLHARAAAKLVRVAGSYSSRIYIIRQEGNVEANAKSILSVLTLAASVGTDLVVRAEGMDESEAFDAVVGLFRDGFGENDN